MYVQLDMIAFVHNCRAVSPQLFQITQLNIKVFCIQSSYDVSSLFKKQFGLYRVFLAIYNKKVQNMKKIIKNHVMTSSWRHFTIYKNLPISNNLPSFNMIAPILRKIYDFKKGTFNAASRDPRWRHWSETSHIWWLHNGQHVCKFWSDYIKLHQTHLQKVHFEQFPTCR